MRRKLMLFMPETRCCLRFGAVFYMLAVFAGSSSFAQPAERGGDGHAQVNKALLDIRHNISLSRERAAALAGEVANLKKDQKSLSNALVAAARAERDLGQDIHVREGRLKVLMARKFEAQADLHRHRDKFARMLAMAERVGLNPPPAMLVHADDALRSVRSAALLGSVMPHMREQTQKLSASLKELDNLAKSVETEQGQLAQAIEAQQGEKERLSLLLAEKAKLQKKSEEDLVAERAHNETLVQKAQSLRELVAELERQFSRQPVNSRGSDSSLLTARTNFAALRGRLFLPVDGRRVRAFSSSSQGETYETAPGAVVTSPVEGIVRYAGAFRSYRQLVIIDAGQNYHLVLAGLGRIDVAQGQVLLQGEPVGVMDAQLVASAGTFDIGKTAPMLYIEIRKDGKPVNPTPWWARR